MLVPPATAKAVGKAAAEAGADEDGVSSSISSFRLAKCFCTVSWGRLGRVTARAVAQDQIILCTGL